MKLRYQFVVRNVSSRPVAVAVGRDNERFNGMIKLNPAGEAIFKLLILGTLTQEEIIARFAEQFGITEDTARPSVLAFINELRKSELLEEDQV